MQVRLIQSPCLKTFCKIKFLFNIILVLFPDFKVDIALNILYLITLDLHEKKIKTTGKTRHNK